MRFYIYLWVRLFALILHIYAKYYLDLLENGVSREAKERMQWKLLI